MTLFHIDFILSQDSRKGNIKYQIQHIIGTAFKMRAPSLIGNIAIIFFISSVSANLEGPFLFWGPKNLDTYRKPALQSLEQDDLIKIYDNQAAIVVFNNQDSVPLSSANFPRLRKLLERQTILVLPQDFLDVHPDYVSNETQVFTLQGPNSERDAEITETFNRLEDIYGRGRVLGLLGNSMSQDYVERSDAFDGDLSRRRRRDANDPDESDLETTTTREPQPEKTPERALPEYALYNASGIPGKALLFSSTWPILRYDSGEEIVLKRPLTATMSTSKKGKPLDFNRLVVTYLTENGKITIKFRFTTSAGWWTAAGAEVQDLTRNKDLLLQEPPPFSVPTAALKRSYHCSQPLVYRAQNASLTFSDIQMQPYMDSTERFSDSFDCSGFMTVPIWSGLGVSFLLVAVLSISICMILDIKTMDKFENNKGKSLTITVTE